MPRNDQKTYVVERPWGRSEFLAEDETYTIKRLIVNPGKRLSYQKHTKREEQWIIACGEALVTLNGEKIKLSAKETIHIPLESAHRVENPHPEDVLVIVEIQRGSYFGDDDTIRLEDDFGRS